MSDTVLELGRVVDRYTVEKELGSGGMAQVFRVRHNTLGTLHALKVLKVQNPSVRDRLVQEGRLQASLRHPNIVAVTDVISVDGAPGLLMEFVAGPSLDVWLDDLSVRGEAPTLPEAERLFRGIVAGVARAHKHGLIHRDLKPGNVLLETADGVLVPKVADFGLAKILMENEGGVSRTRSGVAMGTPAYMSPEQIRDAKNVDQRTDIFALGCIYYELIVGRSPFDGPDVLSIFAALADGRYTPVEVIVPELPAHISATIRACLASNRDERVPDCGTLLTLMDGGTVGVATSQETTGTRARTAASASVGPARSLRPTSGGGTAGSGGDAAGRSGGGATYAVGDSILAADGKGASKPPNLARPTSRPAASSVSLELDPVETRRTSRSPASRASAPRVNRSEPPPAVAPRAQLFGAAGAGLVVLAAVVVIGLGVAIWVGLDSASPGTVVASAPALGPAPSPPPSSLIVNTQSGSPTGAHTLVTVKSGTDAMHGDATSVVLVARDGTTFPPGPIAAGSYFLRATFANGQMATTTLNVAAGATVHVRCSEADQRCETGGN